MSAPRLLESFFYSSNKQLQTLLKRGSQTIGNIHETIGISIDGPPESGKTSLLLTHAIDIASNFEEIQECCVLLIIKDEKGFRDLIPCYPLLDSDAINSDFRGGWNASPSICRRIQIRYMPTYAHLLAFLIALPSLISVNGTENTDPLALPTPNCIIIDDFHAYFSLDQYVPKMGCFPFSATALLDLNRMLAILQQTTTCIREHFDKNCYFVIAQLSSQYLEFLDYVPPQEMSGVSNVRKAGFRETCENFADLIGTIKLDEFGRFRLLFHKSKIQDGTLGVNLQLLYRIRREERSIELTDVLIQDNISYGQI